MLSLMFHAEKKHLYSYIWEQKYHTIRERFCSIYLSMDGGGEVKA